MTLPRGAGAGLTVSLAVFVMTSCALDADKPKQLNHQSGYSMGGAAAGSAGQQAAGEAPAVAGSATAGSAGSLAVGGQDGSGAGEAGIVGTGSAAAGGARAIRPSRGEVTGGAAPNGEGAGGAPNGETSAGGAPNGEAGADDGCPAGLARCDEHCVDLRYDPDHCGSCGQQCELANAASACVAGACVITSCNSGFVDHDGQAANGCEVGVCSVEQTLKAADGNTSASCDDVGPCPADGCCDGVGTCSPDGNGGVRLAYSICADARAWTSCDLGGRYDLSEFDAGGSENQILAVSFCVEQAVTGADLNLWYGQHPLRKFLPLKDSQAPLAVGCYVRYFTQARLRYPQGWCDVPTECESSVCGSPACGAAFAAKAEAWTTNVVLDTACYQDQNAAPAGAHLTSEQLQTSLTNLAAQYTANADGFSLHHTHITITAEGCSSEATGVVDVKSIQLLTAGCSCSSADDCRDPGDRPYCSLEPSDQCDTQSLGVCSLESNDCVGPPGPAVACSVHAGDSDFTGVTRCENGHYVCALD